jgi:uncharacterized protein YcbK (DUF882 family)
MKNLVRGALIAVAALVVSGCQGNNQPHRLASAVGERDGAWAGDYGPRYVSDEPQLASWEASAASSRSDGSKLTAMRRMALGVAPAGADLERLADNIGKRREAEIDCIPVELTMLLNTVRWHYGEHVHIQSGYRSKNHNRAVGGARGSYHLSCEAVDIQVQGVDKYELANFLKDLPGRGGVGTYCNVSTVHVDVGPRREWHYGCRRHSPRRFARLTLRR